MPNLRELARRADVDERTLFRFFSDEPTKPRIKARIERALAEMGSTPATAPRKGRKAA